MIRNKVVEKIGMAIALVGLLSTGVVTTSATVASAEECTYKVESLTGDYTVVNPTDYYLRIKNQGTVGKPITFKTNLSGYGSGIGYTYSFSNRGMAKPADVYGPWASNTYTWTPEYAGEYYVSVKCKDAYGNEQYGSQYVQINDKMEITSFTSDHEKIEGDTQGKAQLGETIKLQTKVEGGYPYGKKYTYTISPRSASPQNRDVVYYSQGDTLSWTPKYAGIYAVRVDVEDEIGNTASKSQYFMIL